MSWIPWPFSILSNQLETIMTDLSKLQADVDAISDAVTDAVTDLQALSKDVADLKAQVGASVQPQIDAMAAKLEGVTKTLTDAVAANPA